MFLVYFTAERKMFYVIFSAERKILTSYYSN